MTRTYEEMSNEIDSIIERKRGNWDAKNFHRQNPSFDDVAQMLRRHIWIKWEQWKQNEPLGPWVNTIIKNQTYNITRNNWGKFAPPCNNSCSFNKGGDLCAFTPSGKKCFECPLYKRWEEKKKDGYNIRFASSVEELMANGGNIPGESGENFDMEKSLVAFHERMKVKLPEKLYRIYEIIYINNEPETVVSKMLGFQNNETSGNANRPPGYKIIFLYKQQIFNVAKEIMEDFDLIKH